MQFFFPFILYFSIHLFFSFLGSCSVAQADFELSILTCRDWD